jgi:hypothetical protein
VTNEKGAKNLIRKLTISCAFILAFGCLGVALAKPDFNGAWVMDRARSFGIPPNMTQTMTVKQTENQIEVETKLIQPENERTVKDVYVLDGKEYDFTPLLPPNAPPNATPPKGKRTANWLPAGDGILVTEITTNETPKGPVTTQVMKKWTFTGASELTITFFVDGPNGSYEAKRIFTKKAN